jgi:hypothetical protein
MLKENLSRCRLASKRPASALTLGAWYYRFHGRPRWLHLGDVRSIGLADARLLAAKTVPEVIEGKDPAAGRRAERITGTFADLAAQYVELPQKAQQELAAGGRIGAKAVVHLRASGVCLLQHPLDPLLELCGAFIEGTLQPGILFAHPT